MTNCQSCGMPMQSPADFGGGKTDNLYCRYCTDATGNLLPKEVVRQNMIQFYTQTVGKTTEEATVEVDKIMGTMPAWKIQPSPVMPASPDSPRGEAGASLGGPSAPVPPVAPVAPVANEPMPPVQPPVPPTSEPLASEPASPAGGSTTVLVPPTTEDKPQ